MSSEALVVNIYNLLNRGIKIWLENEKIKILVPKNQQLTERDKSFIENKRQEIIECLVDNHVYSGHYEILILKFHAYKAELSFAQERLWFLQKYERNTQSYNVPLVFRISSKVDLEILNNCLISIISRHHILKTIILETEKFYSTIISDDQLTFNIDRHSVKTTADLDIEIKKNVDYIFDLSNEIPIKVDLYKLDENNTDFISIIVHHIAFDGWSFSIFLHELKQHYEYYLNKKLGQEAHLNLPILPIQYKDFALWQRNYLQGARLEQQINYWKTKLAGYQTLDLVTDYPRPLEIDYSGHDVYFEIDATTSDNLRLLAKKLGVSLYTVLLSAYYLLLRVYSHQNDIVIGTPVSNRHYEQVEHLIGFFVNSLALRIKIKSEQTIKEFIEEVGKEVIEAQIHQDLPFEKLVEILEVDRIINMHPIFQVMFVLQSFGNLINTEIADEEFILFKEMKLCDFIPNDNTNTVARFDIKTIITDNNKELRGVFQYSKVLFHKKTIEKYIETYCEILRQVASLSTGEKILDFKIRDVNYLKSEKLIPVTNQNKAINFLSENTTLHQLFEEQVKKTPHEIALICDNLKMTYAELNNKANQLAHYIVDHQAHPDDLVLLCLDRNEYMLISILAILKAGCAYIPVDPNYPYERIKKILNDAKPVLIITNIKNKRKIFFDQNVNSKTTKNKQVILIDEGQTLKALDLKSTNSPIVSITNKNLAYVIYTSGTTGTPKGVMIDHQSLVSKLAYILNEENIKTPINIVSKTTYCFDPSIREFFLALLSGSKLFLLSERYFTNPNQLITFFKKNKINLSLFVPTHLLTFLNTLEEKNDKYQSLHLKILYICGEPLTKTIVNKAFKFFPNVKVKNQYGPTEACQFSFEFECKNIHDYQHLIPIGRPIANMQGHILNEDMQVLPIGAVGELYIGGEGLARGYLNRPDLTAEKFVPNPFIQEEDLLQAKNLRLYRTGDLARYLTDGNIEFIGRSDDQVKIRGFRIELGEIEANLLQYPDVSQVVVIVREDQPELKQLVAYVVPKTEILTAFERETVLSASNQENFTILKGKEVSSLTEDLRIHLSQFLPDYMLPAFFVLINKLPLNPNGKIDRKALPAPEITNIEDYVAPRNELEIKICQAWSELLGISENKISIHDDFFKLGGNSLLAIRLANKLNTVIFPHKFSITALFKYPKISDFVQHLFSDLQNEREEYEL